MAPLTYRQYENEPRWSLGNAHETDGKDEELTKVDSLSSNSDNESLAADTEESVQGLGYAQDHTTRATEDERSTLLSESKTSDSEGTDDKEVVPLSSVEENSRHRLPKSFSFSMPFRTWEKYKPRRAHGGVELSGGFTPCRHLRPSSGREHTIVTYSVQ